MYSFSSRIRYSEVDSGKHLDLSAIINYFQDCSTFHSEDLGIGIEYLQSKNCVWLLNAWQIVVTRYPMLGEHITTSTWAYGFNQMYGYRNFTMKDEKNNVISYANSTWVLVDTNTGRPCKVQSIDISKYKIEEKFPMKYAPRKIGLPSETETLESFSIVKSNIDTNNHVNNGQYIKMAEEFLPEGFIISQMRAEYRKSAVLGDIIVPKRYQSGNTCVIVLCDTKNKPYTIIEFISKN